MVTVFVIGGWLVSLCLHEFSHAVVAYIGGDTSVKDKGYLTFNPLKYVHPVTTIIIPVVILLIGGIALPGGAVWIDRSRLKSAGWDSAVSAAGPAANLLLAVLMAVPFMLGMADLSGEGWFWPAWAFLFQLQIVAVFLNLLPIPPLDGYGVIAPYLPEDIRSRLDGQAMLGFAVIMILFWVVPGVSGALWGTVADLSELAGVPDWLADVGAGRTFRLR